MTSNSLKAQGKNVMRSELTEVSLRNSSTPALECSMLIVTRCRNGRLRKRRQTDLKWRHYALAEKTRSKKKPNKRGFFAQ